MSTVKTEVWENYGDVVGCVYDSAMDSVTFIRGGLVNEDKSMRIVTLSVDMITDALVRYPGGLDLNMGTTLGPAAVGILISWLFGWRKMLGN